MWQILSSLSFYLHLNSYATWSKIKSYCATYVVIEFKHFESTGSIDLYEIIWGKSIDRHHYKNCLYKFLKGSKQWEPHPVEISTLSQHLLHISTIEFYFIPVGSRVRHKH